MKKNKLQKGFTLIELLVVMAIIAILSAIMFGPIQTARRRSKDTQAVADMKLIANDLELYAQDNNGIYPASAPALKTALQAYGNVPTRFNSGTSPVDNQYNYVPIVYSGTTTGFHLWTHLSDMNEAFNTDADCVSVSSGFVSCWGSTGYTVASGYTGKDGLSTDNTTAPSASVCTDVSKCILDYANGK